MSKLSKLLLTLPLMFAFLTSGCKDKTPSASQPETSESTPTSSSEPSETEPSEPALEGMTPEEAAADVASCWGGSAELVEEGVYGAYGAFSASSYSVEDMKGYVASLFVPEEFELLSDWATQDDGSELCMYINAVNTVLQFYVYAETLYVDGEGHIVDEGTEGATAVEATCIEVYSFTASAE